jgi:hypothetical protein
MKKSTSINAIAGVCLFGLAGAPLVASAEPIHASLRGWDEVPAVVTSGTGEFHGNIIAATAGAPASVSYELEYSALSSAITMAHIHVGQPGANGGIGVWLCKTAATAAAAPPNTPDCPAPGVKLSDSFVAVDVVGPAPQLIRPTDAAALRFNKLVQAIRMGNAYVNLHTVAVGSGEIRGQIR